MTEEEQQLLFGVRSTYLDRVELIVMEEHDKRWTVRLTGYPNSRNKHFTCMVHIGEEQSLTHVIGLLTRFMHQSWMHPKMWRAAVLKVADRLGQEGYEISLY